jgi:hypothetical protein
LPHEADPQSAYPVLQVGAEPPLGGIAPDEPVQEQRDVRDRACHRPDMIEREGDRKDASARYQVISRLQPDHSAIARRVADRAARVGAERQRHKSSGQRHTRT